MVEGEAKPSEEAAEVTLCKDKNFSQFVIHVSANVKIKFPSIAFAQTQKSRHLELQTFFDEENF